MSLTLHSNGNNDVNPNRGGHFSMSDSIETLGYTALKAIASKLAINPITGSGWQDLADKLGFSYGEILQLENMNCDAATMATNMLKDWLNRRGRSATIGVLEQYLILLGREDVLQELHNRLRAPFNLLIKLVWEGKPDLNLRAEATSEMSLVEAVRDMLKTLGLSYEQVEFNGNWESKAREFVGRELVLKVVGDPLGTSMLPKQSSQDSGHDSQGGESPQQSPREDIEQVSQGTGSQLDAQGAVVPGETQGAGRPFGSALTMNQGVEETQDSSFLPGTKNVDLGLNGVMNLGTMEGGTSYKSPLQVSSSTNTQQLQGASLDTVYGTSNNISPTSMFTLTASVNNSAVHDTRHVTGKMSESFQGVEPMELDITTPKTEQTLLFQSEMQDRGALGQGDPVSGDGEITPTEKSRSRSSSVQVESFSEIFRDQRLRSNSVPEIEPIRMNIPVDALNIPPCSRTDTSFNNKSSVSSLNNVSNSLNNVEMTTSVNVFPATEKVSWSLDEEMEDVQTLVKQGIKDQHNCQYCKPFAQHYKSKTGLFKSTQQSSRFRSNSSSVSFDNDTIYEKSDIMHSLSTPGLKADGRGSPDGKDKSTCLKTCLCYPGSNSAHSSPDPEGRVPSLPARRKSPPLQDRASAAPLPVKQRSQPYVPERKRSPPFLEKKRSAPLMETEFSPPLTERKMTSPRSEQCIAGMTGAHRGVMRTDSRPSDSESNIMAHMDLDNQSVNSEMLEDPSPESLYITILPGWHPLLENNGKKVFAVMKPYLGKDGYYIIRSLDHGKKGVTVTHQGQLKHFKIHMTEERGTLFFYFYRDGFQATSIQDLIKYYHTHDLSAQMTPSHPEGGATDGHVASLATFSDDSAGASSLCVEVSMAMDSQSASASQPVRYEGSKHIRLRAPVAPVPITINDSDIMAKI
ncbi:uncharacterized protein LOC106162389 [Lingula anatina]|uniref:Uncharacterized protein LOC106162389 n=1 Tax=Lingula anatina TaxID=7574 RepID=A0A1S3IA48_LINAN|nr:uncharacterized protein LOC106162389 [Lingula anatina]|eukprot:XP_013395132.1 uncharacterized protein LOC106162389 [Lingula anatina]